MDKLSTPRPRRHSSEFGDAKLAKLIETDVLDPREFEQLPDLSSGLARCIVSFAEVEIPCSEQSLKQIQAGIRGMLESHKKFSASDAWEFICLASFSPRIVFQVPSKLENLDGFYDVEELKLAEDQENALQEFARMVRT